MTKITFIEHSGITHHVDANDGLSLMEVARDSGVPGILADCGGARSCATCHVYLDEAWMYRAGQPSEVEQSMLECAIDPGPNSRLSCQVNVNPGLAGLIVRIPKCQL